MSNKIKLAFIKNIITSVNIKPPNPLREMR